MTLPLEIYKCEICGNIIEVLHAGEGGLVCCSRVMALMTENTTDADEKHLPVIEKTAAGIKVSVGGIDRHSDETHYIEWIEAIADGRSHMKFLNPGDTPEARFAIRAVNVTARAYCNLHGLWKNVLDLGG
jgi:superoxide reductase